MCVKASQDDTGVSTKSNKTLRSVTPNVISVYAFEKTESEKQGDREKMELLNYEARLIDVEYVSVSGKVEPNIISTAIKAVEMIVRNVGSIVKENSDTIKSVMRT
eukprot:TRINITY_DN6341_c0_g1_i4.p1 TRINITY_DN6341_c0_g1~~TRINITY_DN6341_c0_g1_i4.p1  ORF type:complete len:105 (+),score=9.89 TRINITY_DN6341_c0_g1_i4:194-508(+)